MRNNQFSKPFFNISLDVAVITAKVNKVRFCNSACSIKVSKSPGKENTAVIKITLKEINIIELTIGT